ncbi:hypothetical protein [Streptomyces sp. NPDC018947]|uniref:hypothetical protein n=1 Tax=Streptomyces sp. NPDC018947 TaxID=3365054 RepID=UPI0037A3D081
MCETKHDGAGIRLFSMNLPQLPGCGMSATTTTGVEPVRKLSAVFATLGLATVGVLVPTGTAQAETNCDSQYWRAALGYMYAYEYLDCHTALGLASGDDSNWGNDLGAFQGGDTNRASSVLHRGTSGMAVQFFNGTGTDWAGGHSCLKKSELYADDLNDNYFTSGVPVGQNISSHRWVWEGECDRFMT